ncbi:MAG: patatin-like phospholipase family protein [Reichenbachiella sp.]|uniref:patatin-like phospholipase family protein n=1 Tax=Reichenbachiella sp. TaxID=2184521 RepID=UPI0032999B6D
MINKQKIGLCLSGGGYRAAAYHMGTLRKLREMDILDKIDVISSNSGGSITAATYCLNKGDWKSFENQMLKGLSKNMIFRLVPRLVIVLLVYGLSTWFLWRYLNAYTLMGTTTVLFLIMGFFQYQILPFSQRNEKSYKDFFVGRSQLKDLPSSPELVMNSTNMETGNPFVFATDQMGDTVYRYREGDKSITFKHKDFPIARAVAASTCVPFAFSPVRIKKRFFKPESGYKDAVPRLVDGGVYDNQGIHRLTHSKSRYKCNIIIVSDAGNDMPFKNTYRNVLSLLIRVSDVFMTRIRNLQVMELLYDSIENKQREIAYQALSWSPEHSIDKFIDSVLDGNVLDHVWKSHKITEADIERKDRMEMTAKLKQSIDYEAIVKTANDDVQTKLARSVGTNLVPINQTKQKALINHAYVMTELQVRLYCPSMVG